MAISAEINARIVSMPFREGDRFHAGTTLVEFDCRRTRAELAAGRPLTQQDAEAARAERARWQAELAVLYDASGLAESDAVNGYGREYGTSGNQHGIARLLAGARRNDPEWSAAGSVSALSPITGEPFYVKEPK